MIAKPRQDNRRRFGSKVKVQRWN